MGFNYVQHKLDHWQPEIANPRGNFDFSGNQTALNVGQAANFYNTFASFLLGEVEWHQQEPSVHHDDGP